MSSHSCRRPRARCFAHVPQVSAHARCIKPGLFLGCHRNRCTYRGWYAFPVRTVRGGLGTGRPAPPVRTQRGRLVRAPQDPRGVRVSLGLFSHSPICDHCLQWLSSSTHGETVLWTPCAGAPCSSSSHAKRARPALRTMLRHTFRALSWRRR